MTGLVTLQQGPFGVAASARRPVERPAVAGRTRVPDSMGAQLGDAPKSAPQRHQNDPDKTEEFQPVATTVSPGTLLDASLLSADIDPGAGIQSPALSARLGTWEPPHSSLSLRDRRV